MSQLVLQLILASVLIVIATAVQASGIVFIMKHRHRLVGRIGRFRAWVMIGLLSTGALWMLAWQMAGVCIWALVFVWIGAFSSHEPSLYFALAAYTTLGFGDVLPPEEWRILGAFIGANGMLGFGLGIAALSSFVLGIRDDLEALDSQKELS